MKKKTTMANASQAEAKAQQSTNGVVGSVVENEILGTNNFNNDNDFDYDK